MNKIKLRIIGLKFAKHILAFLTLGLAPLFDWLKDRIKDLDNEINKEIEKENK